MTEIKDFKNFITKELSRIPNFIDTTSSTHFMIWGSLCEVNLILLKLVSNTVLSEKIIFKMVKQVDEVFDELDNILTNELQVKVLIYFMKVKMLIENKSIDYEFYETTANINRFNNIYLENNPIT